MARINGLILDEVLRRVGIDATARFDIGAFEKLSWINELGYEDTNALLETSTGRYLLKVFADRTRQSAHTYVHNCQVVAQSAARIPKLLLSKDDEVLLLTNTTDGLVAWCLLEYIDGVNLANDVVTDDDILQTLDQMASFHAIEGSIENQKDSWSPVALAATLPRNSVLLKNAERVTAANAAMQMNALASQALTFAPIHGSLEPSNLIRDLDGKIVVVDLGTISVAPVIVDIGIFAISCVLTSATNEDEFVKRSIWLLSSYLENCALNTDDVAAFPVVLEATYWSYLLAARSCWERGDQRNVTARWLQLAVTGTEMMPLVSDKLRAAISQLVTQNPNICREP